MKKIQFTMLLCIIACTGYSQKIASNKPTKAATQEWIKEKIGLYAYNSEDGKIKNEYIVSFEGEDILIKDLNWDNLSGTYTFITRIPIIGIDYISTVEKSHNLWLIINLKSNYVGSKLSLSTNTKYDLKGKCDILLNKSFMENDLPNRMKKAFARLVEIYGGKYSEKKEPF